MKGVTFSVFCDNFKKANIGLTYKGTTNVAFFSHFNMFTLCSFIFFKDGFEKKGNKFCKANVYWLFSRDVCQSNGLHQRFCWENLLDFPP